MPNTYKHGNKEIANIKPKKLLMRNMTGPFMMNKGAHNYDTPGPMKQDYMMKYAQHFKGGLHAASEKHSPDGKHMGPKEDKPMNFRNQLGKAVGLAKKADKAYRGEGDKNDPEYQKMMNPMNAVDGKSHADLKAAGGKAFDIHMRDHNKGVFPENFGPMKYDGPNMADKPYFFGGGSVSEDYKAKSNVFTDKAKEADEKSEKASSDRSEAQSKLDSARNTRRKNRQAKRDANKARRKTRRANRIISKQ